MVIRLGTSSVKGLTEGKDGMNMEHIEKLPLKDKRITCLDCEATFTFTLGEQRYFLSKGLSEPKRCPQCRLKRKLCLVPDREVRW